MEVKKKHPTFTDRVDSSNDSLTAIEPNGTIIVPFEYIYIYMSLSTINKIFRKTLCYDVTLITKCIHIY